MSKKNAPRTNSLSSKDIISETFEVKYFVLLLPGWEHKVFSAYKLLHNK